MAREGHSQPWNRASQAAGKTPHSKNPAKQGQLGTGAEPPRAALGGWREFPSDAVENIWTLVSWTRG